MKIQAMAEALLAFVRHSQCVQAIDLGVWLYKGNAESQVAGFLTSYLQENPL